VVCVLFPRKAADMNVAFACVATGSCDAAPSAGMISDFIRVCQDYLSKESTGVIGVFDEYGCNRSLTLIARFGVTGIR
jgi:hypothetical protein